MATNYNAQICNDEGKYLIQFETSNYEYFRIVEKACQKVIDLKDKEVMKERCSQMRTLGHM